jgi:hypothetical protein
MLPEEEFYMLGWERSWVEVVVTDHRASGYATWIAGRSSPY